MLNICYEKLIDRYFNVESSEKVIHHCCIVCGNENSNALLNRCPDCNGTMDSIYNLHSFLLAKSANPLERYFSLLPIKNQRNLIWLGDGNTPYIHAEALGKEVGLPNLFLKDETVNPTRSTKDRIASVGLSRFKELGIRHLVVASTGNSSVAYARGVQMTGDFKIDIFVAKDFLHRLNYHDHPNVRTYVCDSDFVGAGAHGKHHADKEKLFFEGGFFSLSRREGLKLAYLEAFDQLPIAPQYIFQAISSGMGLLGAYKGAIEYKVLGRLAKLPRFIGVQQTSCSPMAQAYAEKSDTIKSQHIIKNPKGIAEAILRGDPSQSYPYIHSICTSTDGQIISVNDEEIKSAHQQLMSLQGVFACYAGATALAGAIKMRQAKLISKEAPTLINITGGNRPFSPVPQKIIRAALEN